MVTDELARRVLDLFLASPVGTIGEIDAAMRNALTDALNIAGREQPTSMWVATEFSVDNGGRAWIQAATDPDAAKRLCQERYTRQGYNGTLDWQRDDAAEWMTGQKCESARYTSGRDYYEIRRVEVA